MGRAFVALLAMAVLPSFVLGEQWETARFPGTGVPLVEIRHHPRDRGELLRIVRLVEFARERFNALADTQLTTTVRVVAASSRREYESITQGMVPEWSSAAAVPAEKTIFISLDSYGKPLEFTIPHEVSHVLPVSYTHLRAHET